MREIVLNQIEDVKNRSARALLDENHFLNEFRDEWLRLKDSSTEFVKYVPIRLCTVIEVRVRKTIQELIDHGEPYLTRSKPLWNKSKPDFEVLFGVLGKRVTVGELVAHSVSLNSFGQISGVLEVLLPELDVSIATTKDRYNVEVLGGRDVPIVEELEKMKKQLHQLIETRHVLVHELPDENFFDATKIDGFFEATTQFLNALSWISLFNREGMVPLTQTEMTGYSFNDCEVARDEMKVAVDEFVEAGLFDAKMLEASNELWEKSALCDASISASYVEGGTMQPMIFSSALANAYRYRAAFIRNLLRSHPEY